MAKQIDYYVDHLFPNGISKLSHSDSCLVRAVCAVADELRQVRIADERRERDSKGQVKMAMDALKTMGIRVASPTSDVPMGLPSVGLPSFPPIARAICVCGHTGKYHELGTGSCIGFTDADQPCQCKGFARGQNG